MEKQNAVPDTMDPIGIQLFVIWVKLLPKLIWIWIWTASQRQINTTSFRSFSSKMVLQQHHCSSVLHVALPARNRPFSCIIYTCLLCKLFNMAALNCCPALLSAAQSAQMTSYREINDAPLVLLFAYTIYKCVCVSTEMRLRNLESSCCVYLEGTGPHNHI